MPRFEIAVHNAAVRACLAEGDRHRQLSDEWADTHYIEVSAADKPAALAKARAKYGEANGYVIESVTPIADD